MSAWAELVNSDGSDEWLELCSKALTEVQAETSHRNAERIRGHDFDATLVGTRCGCSEGLTDEAADLIDPEKET